MARNKTPVENPTVKGDKLESKTESTPEPDTPKEQVVVETAEKSDPTPVSEPKPETEPESVIQPPTKEVRRSSNGFVGFLLGGLLAGAAGFVASQFIGNQNWPFTRGPSDFEILDERIVAQQSEISTLVEKNAQLESALDGRASAAEAKDLGARLSELKSLSANVAKTIATIDQRIAELENRPNPDSGADAAAVVAYERELAAMRQMFQQELDRVTQAQFDVNIAKTIVADQAANSERNAALRSVESAVKSGEPFSKPLSVLRANGVEVPAVLNKLADIGVVTLATLQSRFPDAARSALNADNQAKVASQGTASKIGAFLRNQLGARSLKPREGNDADAVLSRAEAALRNGNLTAALVEIDDLSDAAAMQLVDWVALVNSRLSAEQALASITVSKSN